jgi:hypothetical protein
MPNKETSGSLRWLVKQLEDKLNCPDKYTSQAMKKVLLNEVLYLGLIERYFEARPHSIQNLSRKTLADEFPKWHRIRIREVGVINGFCRAFNVLLVNNLALDYFNRPQKTFTLVGFEYDVRIVMALLKEWQGIKELYRKKYRMRLKLYKRRHKQLTSEKRQLFRDNRSLFIKMLDDLYARFYWKILSIPEGNHRKGLMLSNLSQRIYQEKFFRFRRNKPTDKYWYESKGKAPKQVHFKTLKPLTINENYFLGRLEKASTDRYLPPKYCRKKTRKPKYKRTPKRVFRAIEYLTKIKKGEIPD